MVPTNKYPVHFVNANSQIIVKIVGLKKTMWIILFFFNKSRGGDLLKILYPAMIEAQRPDGLPVMNYFKSGLSYCQKLGFFFKLIFYFNFFLLLL